MSIDTLKRRPPTQAESEDASKAAKAVAGALTREGLTLGFVHDGEESKVDLKRPLALLVLDLLTHVARGEMVTFVPYGAELTTQQAADVLNVSRPFLIGLLEGGKIAFHTVGSHRRIQMADLLDYKKARDAQRSASLKELQKLGQEYDAG
ncbi:excisionase family DNA-binding protein [Methyloligella solikamskensis]|uniref:Excisionase family DNA-binding protein n=1 Tax=Methyloligella solikamskensis TaxID=1177756 RepID=A0ABW3J7T9_9HYPH